MIVRQLIVFGAIALLLSCAAQDSQPPGHESAAADDQPLYLTLETPPAPILNPRQALQTFVVAPGFGIELVAAEPLLEDPVAADWDEDGRLYVAEMRAYMPDVQGAGEEEPIGAVVRLSDDDGDGVFDSREVLIDDLVLPRALRVVNDGLLVAEMGKLWLCPSSSGWSKDIDCAAKRFLGAYGEHQGSVEHAENGLLLGLDNWLYNAKSSRRLKLVDGALVEAPTIFRGQWGITQDDHGRLFYNTNSNLLLGDYYDAQAIIAAGNRTAPGLNTRISPNDEVYSVRVNPGVNRAYLPGVLREDGRLRTATSASGMVVYRGGRFAPEDPNAFVTEPAGNLIAAFKLSDDGLKVAAEHLLYPDERWGQRDFLASTDERFRPVDVLNGPDGSLYVIDFYRGVIQDHVYLSEQLKAQVLARKLDRPLGMGRLWRVFKQHAPPAAALPNWQSATTADFVLLLGAADIWRRSTAQRLLLRHDDPDTATQLQALVSNGALQAAIHGLWILEGRGELSRATVLQGLRRQPPLAQAALLAGGHLLSVADLQSAVSSFAAGSKAFLYSLAALRHHMNDDRVLAVLQQTLLENLADHHVRAFVQAALRGREDAFIRLLVGGAQWTPAREQSTQLLGLLARQFFRAEGAGAVALLDFVVQRPAADLWIQQALLAGLFETTRETGFERAQLNTPHPLFASRDETLWPAVAKARRAFTWPGDDLAADAKPLTPLQARRMEKGRQFFATSCANCHGADGAGVAALGPPLADSPWVTQAPERLARIVLHGLRGPIEVAGVQWDSAMPGHKDFAGFDDAVASGLLTYLRRSWGHTGRAIDAEFVAQIREQTADRTQLWTVAELAAIRINTHYEKYVGAFGRPNAAMQFAYDGKDLTVDAGIFSGPLVELKEDHYLYEPRAIQFEFVVADDGSVPAVIYSTGDGSRTLPRVPRE